MNYEKKLKQLDARRGDMSAQFVRATEKAHKQAMFEAGKMLLNCIDAQGDWRGIKWEKLADYFSRESTKKKWHDWFYTDDFETGEPGKRLKDYIGY